jgi:hypothetical protein
MLSKTPLLITESEKEFAELKMTLVRELEPRNFIERMYVDDIAEIVWEIRRLRRYKDVIVNMAFKDAVYQIIDSLLGPQRRNAAERQILENAPNDWFWDRKTRKVILEALEDFNLDESAIEAAAIRSRFSELERLEKMLALKESRRDKALRSIAIYQASFANKVGQVSNRIIEGDPVVQLEDRSAVKKSA